MSIYYFIYTYFIVGSLNAWKIELELRNERSEATFASRFTVKIQSDAGGKAEKQCHSYNAEFNNCNDVYRVWSSQGGYRIEKLNCEGQKCTLQLLIDGKNFQLEIETQERVDLESHISKFNLIRQVGKGRREFSVYEHGVEYND